MLIRQTLLYFPAQFLAPVAQFVGILLWTWWLPPEEMSSFALVTATQDFAYLFALSWFSFYTLRYMPAADDKLGRQQFLDNESAVLSVLFLPQVLAALGAALLFNLGGGILEASFAMTAFFVTRGLNVHYAERARAQSNILAYTILQTAGPLGGTILGLAALEYVGPEAINLILAQSLAQFIGNLIAMPMIGISLRITRFNGAIMTAALAYGGPILALNLLSWAAENNVRYIVEHFAGAAAFGLLSVGWGIGRRATSVAAMLVAAAAFPIAARLLNDGKRDEAMRQLTNNCALLMAVLVPTVVGLCMVGHILIDLAVAGPYREVTKAILGLATVGGAIRYFHLHVTDQLFLLERRFMFAGIVSVVEIVAIVIFGALGLYLGGLSGTGGLVGTVIGAGLGSLAATLVSLVLAIRDLGFRFPVVDVARISIASAAMAAMLWLVPMPTSYVGLLAAVLLGAAVYSLAMAGLYFTIWWPRLSAWRAARAI